MNARRPPLPDPESLLPAFAFSWTDDEGSDWSTAPAVMRVTPTGVQYAGSITRDGARVGGVGRRVVASAEDGIVVKHTGIEITDLAARGCGFGKRYWQASLDTYARFGINRVTFIAADDGKTFWARPRVQFADPTTPAALLRNWTPDGIAESAGAAGFDEAAQRAGHKPSAIVDFMRDVVGDPTRFTPFELWNLPLGRLLLSGSSWHGVVDL